MDELEFTRNQEEVRRLFDSNQYEEARELLQECIYAFHVESRKFMELLLKEYDDQKVKDVLTSLYFWNYV